MQVAPDTTLDTLDIDARDVAFDVGAKRIEKVGRTTFTGTVSQRNLTAYLTHRQPLVPGLAVQILARDVRAMVPVEAAGLHTKAVIAGTLVPDAAKPDHLNFKADSASIGLLPIPARWVNFALTEVNPVFDLSRLKVPITLTRADVVNGQIVLQGTADLINLRQ